MAVTDEAISKIKDMIVSGKLTPGSRLPREADLAAELGLSRNSLREAVRALSLVRILEVRQGDGTFVSSLAPEVLLESVGFLLDFQQDDALLEFFGVRRILEPAATAAAARLMSDEDIAQLRSLAEAPGLDINVKDLVEADLAFHARIAGAAGNSVLALILDAIALPTARARICRGMTQADAVAQTIAQHCAIVEAIAARDPELAAARAVTHIAAVEDWLHSNDFGSNAQISIPG